MHLLSFFAGITSPTRRLGEASDPARDEMPLVDSHPDARQKREQRLLPSEDEARYWSMLHLHL